MSKQTVIGPRGIKLHLDPAQVFPNDPGAGSPALVEYRKSFGSYTCATCEGYCDSQPVPQECIDWLNSPEIDALVEGLWKLEE